jgi:GNAT superfamily N-acetyltransferase
MLEHIHIIHPEAEHAEAVRELVIKSARLVEAMDMEDGAWQVFCDYNDYEKTKQRVTSDEFKYWIAVNEIGAVVGVLVLEIKSAKLNHLFVDPDFLKQRIASRLWDNLMRYCKAQNISSLVVNASSYAIPVYRRWGFSSTGQPDKRMGITCYPMQINF